MCGYIPTKKEIPKGGYEVQKCSKKFRFNSIIHQDIENTIHKKVEELIEN